MKDEEFLKTVHHVLMEVCFVGNFIIYYSHRTLGFVDARRVRTDGMPELQARISHYEWYPQYGESAVSLYFTMGD